MSEDEDPFGLKETSDDLPQMAPEPLDEEPTTESKEAEFLGQAGLQVTGQSRMEAAYGSGDGDEDGTAVVSKTGSVESGTIFHQVYRPWRGKLNSRWVRNWTILRHHIYGIFTKGHRPWPTYTKLIMVIVTMGALIPIFTLFLGSMTGSEELKRIFGVTRANLWGHVLGTFHNICCWPLITALVVGGLISEDRQHGTSAIYFSRPITRTDYTLMKFISAALVLSLIIVFSYCAYYAAAIVLNNEGWGYLLDTFPYFFGGFVAAVMLVVTYTSIGLALSSISKGKFFPAVAFIGVVFGSKLIAFLIELLFERDALYLLSPHDNLAHVGQWMMKINTTYDFPVAWSMVALLVMNAVSLYVLINRVNSLEVTRE